MKQIESGPQPHMVAAEDYAAGLKVELDRAMDELAKARGLIFAHLRRIAELEAEVTKNGESLAKLAGTVGDMNGDQELRDAVTRIDTNLNRRVESFVTREEFEPIKRLVYGAVALVLTSFMVTLIVLVAS